MQVILIDDFPCPPPFDGWTREIDIFCANFYNCHQWLILIGIVIMKPKFIPEIFI